MARATQAIINLDALNHNYRQVKQIAPNAVAYAVIKANAYGHGLCEVALHLAKKVDSFAVACVDEAKQLRKAGVSVPILVLQGPYDAEELNDCVTLALEIVLQNHNQFEWVQNIDHPLKIWIKVDTGMHRLGLSASDAHKIIMLLQENSVYHDLGVMSHFACADEPDHPFNAEQQTLFGQFQALGLPWCLCNSAAVLSLPSCHGQAIRPGLMLYGVSPFPEQVGEFYGLKAVMTLRTEIQTRKVIPIGDSTGYGRNWRAKRKTILAVAAIGYGDGYPRHARSGTPVLVNGQRASLVGRVSMDMITIDVTDVGEVKQGDEVILWGPELPPEEIAKYCDTIPYELFCQVGIRVPRIYK